MATMLAKLLSQPESQRDASWEQQFLKLFPEGHLTIDHPEAQQGPDGWPYLFVKTEPQSEEPVLDVLEWLSTQGVGLALNPQKQIPDYIFTYGMIWGYYTRRDWGISSLSEPNGEVIYEEGARLVAGAPTEEYLPPPVREILREYLAAQGVESPQILLMGEEDGPFDLLLSLDSLGHPPESEHEGIAEAISWFLPPDYSLVLAPQKGLPNFHRL